MNSSNAPLVSVIIPSYNSSLTICETLESVYAQTYPHIEVLVIDDNSNDDSIALINEQFPQTNVLTKEHAKKGVSATRNYGIKRARGQYIAFLDSDDVWLPSKLEKQLTALKDCRWSYCNSFYFGFNQDGQTLRSDLSELHDGYVFEALLLDNFLTTSTILIEKTLLEQHQMFDEDFTILEDWKLWLTIAKEEPIAYVSEPLARYRVTPGSTSRNAREVYPFHKRLIDHAFSDLAPKWLPLKRQALANSNTICSYIAQDNRDWFFALSCAVRAITFMPQKVSQYKRPLSILYNCLLGWNR